VRGPLGNDEGFKRQVATQRHVCACGRHAPEGRHVYIRADGAFRCVHCQLRARHSTMTDEESLEMLERLVELCATLPCTIGEDAESASCPCMGGEGEEGGDDE
jgi:hypothetical protein